ncbi:MAG: glutathione S-transferase family protein [Steroidobacteraceae bacterium]|nr:glutathione S-transferase family protein [Steroidobacteraceae bacterium]
MKLYNNGFAPSPRRVRMFAAEKGLALDIVELDIAAGATQTAEFLAINPLGETPVLELDDGTRLTESLAICRYLEALYPEPNLFGRAPLEAARIEAATLQLMFRAYVPSRDAFRHTHRFWAQRLRQIPDWGEESRSLALAEWRRWDSVLARQPFVAGERFSFADIVAFTTLEFGKPGGIRPLEELPHLARWREAIAARPSAAA